MDKLLNTVSAAAHYGVTRGWIHRLCKRGILPAEQVGRDWIIREDDAARVLSTLPGSGNQFDQMPRKPRKNKG